MPQTWIDLPGGFGLLGGHLYFVHTENLQGSFIVRPVSYFSNFQQWELLVPKPRGPRKTYCMFDTRKEVVTHALGMWANYIETGTVTMGAADAIKRGKPGIIQPLNLDQQEHVVKLRKLQQLLLSTTVDLNARF